ncbi:Myb DNA-bind 3 domain-containing protein [Abeliophyllum distichum]|uniref:Myb DNA-bind 3 domain-containing protein n=1 Tax=Abeliophyllum distichum TaxID=126358 RepID=A0ABD1V688_9LAMI
MTSYFYLNFQSLLRGRFLRNERPDEEERPPSRAASELNQLRQWHTVSGQRVFMYNAPRIDLDKSTQWALFFPFSKLPGITSHLCFTEGYPLWYSNMGGHRGKNILPMSWSDENEHSFIEILYEKVKSNALQCSTFTKDEWGKINATMIATTKMDYGIERLKGKWNRLRKVHRMFSELLGHTGVTWDPNTNKVNAAEEVWQHFYTVNKSDYKIFKREGCKHYHILGEIFSGTTATGGLGNASTQLPAMSDEERQLEDDFLNQGVHVHVENIDDDADEVPKRSRREDIGTSGERRRKEPKISKSDKLDACMAQWSSTVTGGDLEFDRIDLQMKNEISLSTLRK